MNCQVQNMCPEGNGKLKLPPTGHSEEQEKIYITSCCSCTPPTGGEGGAIRLAVPLLHMNCYPPGVRMLPPRAAVRLGTAAVPAAAVKGCRRPVTPPMSSDRE